MKLKILMSRFLKLSVYFSTFKVNPYLWWQFQFHFLKLLNRTRVWHDRGLDALHTIRLCYSSFLETGAFLTTPFINGHDMSFSVSFRTLRNNILKFHSKHDAVNGIKKMISRFIVNQGKKHFLSISKPHGIVIVWPVGVDINGNILAKSRIATSPTYHKLKC